MTSLLRFRPLVAVLVALTVLVTACGGDDDAVIAGADADTVYLRHSASGEAIICEGVDSLVLAQGHSPVTDLEEALADSGLPLWLAGDCLAPRSAEEAVFEGLEAGLAA